jgi:DNA-binding MarR family transcriptional regulator
MTIPDTAPATGVMWGLLHAAQAVEDLVERALAPSGLSLSKHGVLTQLVEENAPLALSELAVRLSCVRSNMTQLIDRLEADGLVCRLDDPADRRSVRAAVTAAGRERQQAGAVALAEVQRQLDQALIGADTAALSRWLGAVESQSGSA